MAPDTSGPCHKCPLTQTASVDLNFYNFVLQRLCSMLLLFLFSFSIIFVSFSLTVLWIMESSLDEVVFHTVTIVHKRNENKKSNNMEHKRCKTKL